MKSNGYCQREKLALMSDQRSGQSASTLAGYLKGTSKIQFCEQPLCGLPAYPVSSQYGVTRKNYRLQLDYMPRSNFLLVPCLA